jgi:amino acid transporter
MSEWTILSYALDSILIVRIVASMAEEVHNPSVQVPRAIVLSIPIGFLTGVFFLLPILFTLPDVAGLLEGQPPKSEAL